MRSVYSATARSAAMEEIEQEVTNLFEDRGQEFFRYAFGFGRNEELAKDTVQEAFLRYFVARCKGEKIDSPRAWIYRVIHNYLLDRMKQADIRQEESLRGSLSYESKIERLCLVGEILRVMRESLSLREYECLRLRTDGLRYEEIGARMRLTSGTVGTLVSRSMRKIRRLVKAEQLGLEPLEHR